MKEDLSEAVAGDEAEALLGEMVECGDEPHGGAIALDPEFARAATEAAERLFLERQQSIRARLEEGNEAFIERRLASVRTSFQRKLQRLGKRLQEGRERGSQERYLRMLQGQISRTEAEHLAKERELNALRGVQLEHTEVAAGILEVLGPLPAA